MKLHIFLLAFATCGAKVANNQVSYQNYATYMKSTVITKIQKDITSLKEILDQKLKEVGSLTFGLDNNSEVNDIRNILPGHTNRNNDKCSSVFNSSLLYVRQDLQKIVERNLSVHSADLTYYSDYLKYIQTNLQGKTLDLTIQDCLQSKKKCKITNYSKTIENMEKNINLKKRAFLKLIDLAIKWVVDPVKSKKINEGIRVPVRKCLKL